MMRAGAVAKAMFFERMRRMSLSGRSRSKVVTADEVDQRHFPVISETTKQAIPARNRATVSRMSTPSVLWFRFSTMSIREDSGSLE